MDEQRRSVVSIDPVEAVRVGTGRASQFTKMSSGPTASPVPGSSHRWSSASFALSHAKALQVWVADVVLHVRDANADLGERSEQSPTSSRIVEPIVCSSRS